MNASRTTIPTLTAAQIRSSMNSFSGLYFSANSGSDVIAPMVSAPAVDAGLIPDVEDANPIAAQSSIGVTAAPTFAIRDPTVGIKVGSTTPNVELNLLSDH